jgi:hypothetical protein
MLDALLGGRADCEPRRGLDAAISGNEQAVRSLDVSC